MIDLINEHQINILNQFVIFRNTLTKKNLTQSIESLNPRVFWKYQ